MSDSDSLWMRTVDELAAELLAFTPSELLARPEYGISDREIEGQVVPVGFWHYAFGDEHHIHFKVTRSRTRRWSLFPYTSYASGIVFRLGSSPRLMTPDEVAEYL